MPLATHVNTSSQKLPTKDEIENNKQFLANLRVTLAHKLTLTEVTSATSLHLCTYRTNKAAK
jgi:hypothetical protein